MQPIRFFYSGFHFSYSSKIRIVFTAIEVYVGLEIGLGFVDGCFCFIHDDVRG